MLSLFNFSPHILPVCAIALLSARLCPQPRWRLAQCNDRRGLRDDGDIAELEREPEVRPRGARHR